MEQVTAFKASDGAIFETVDQCQEHEVSFSGGSESMISMRHR